MSRNMVDSGVEWIGKIPEGWLVCPIKHVASLYTGNSVKDEDKDSYTDPVDARPYIATKDIDVVLGLANYANGQFVKLSDTSFKIAPSGSTLMCIEGGSAGRKKTFLTQDVAFVNKLCCFCGNDKIEGAYLYRFLSSPNYEEEFACHVSGMIGGVSVSELNNIPFVIPPKAEQKRISDFLDKKCSAIDDVLAKTQESIEEYKKLKQAVITEAVTKGIRGKRPMKKTGSNWFNDLPEGWTLPKVRSMLSMGVIDGPHESPELVNEGIPYISATAIENGTIKFDKMRGFITEEYCNVCDKRYKPQLHDILMIKLGATTGQVAVVETEERFNIWVPLAAIRCNEKSYYRYMYYVFQSKNLMVQMELMWTFGTQQTLGVKTIEQLRVPCPSFEEQLEIANYLDKKCAAIDTLISKKQQFIEELTAYKKSLIYEYVTGKKEVPA